MLIKRLIGLQRTILPPFQGLDILWTVDPGRRSQIRSALGYYVSGFQPFGVSVPFRNPNVIPPVRSGLRGTSHTASLSDQQWQTTPRFQLRQERNLCRTGSQQTQPRRG